MGEGKNARVLIITDRTESDEQIEGVFKRVNENIYRTESGADLIATLNASTPWLISSLVHKFGGKGDGDSEIDVEAFVREMKQALPPGFKAKGDLYVFVDECHRTQSGELHRAMKVILPNAMFIGFTGTPLLKTDKQKSIEVFGRYIHTYKLSDSGMSQKFQRLLRIGNSHGATVIRNGKAYDPYCVKVLSSREPPCDAALASRKILIGMSPTDRAMSPLDQDTAERIAAEFQPKLLMFRLHNFDRFGAFPPLSAEIGDLTPRVRDLVRALAVPLLGNANLQTALAEILHEQDLDARVHRALEPEWLVAEALFGLCHPGAMAGGLFPRTINVLVGTIAGIINENMKERGEEVTLRAKKTGLVLRALGFRTKLLGSLGRGLLMTPAIRESIHRVAQRLGISRRHLVPSLDDEPKYGHAPCDLCEKFSLTGGLRFEFLEARAPRASVHRPRLVESELDTGS